VPAPYALAGVGSKHHPLGTMKWIWVVVGIAWFAASVSSAVLYFVAANPSGHPDFLLGLFLNGLVWGYWVALGPLIVWITRRIPIRPLRWMNVGAHAAVAVACLVLHAVGLVWLGKAAGYVQGETFTRAWLGIMSTAAVPDVFLYSAIVAAITAVDAAEEARRRETQAAVLSAELASARLDALLLQLQPHFVLNTLNTVAILIREAAPADALNVVLDLGALLQGMLSKTGQQEHTLAEEIAFVRRYLHIEQVRFADRLQTAVDIDDNLGGAAVPRYVLQPIVENALRHGIARSESGGKIAIAAWRTDGRLWLRVTDSGPGLPPDIERGIGLANVQRRLTHLYDANCALMIERDAADNTAATMWLPYRPFAEGE
jgi:two-component system, LytTR family, sensor kinase